MVLLLEKFDWLVTCVNSGHKHKPRHRQNVDSLWVPCVYQSCVTLSISAGYFLEQRRK